MESSKWIAAVASIWVQCSSGATYAFGIYSPILKSTQAYDQSTLDTVSVFKDIGANAGVLSGLLYAAVVSGRGHSRLSGPWVVHVAGAVQCFVGYLFMWLAVTGIVPRPHVGIMCLFMFLAAHAQTFFNTANVVTALHNFPHYGGTIVGLMKGFLGLSGALLIQVYHTLFAGKASNFILMLALVPTLFSLVLMFYVTPVHHTQPAADAKRYLNGFSLISIIVGAYLTFLIFFDNVFAPSQWLRASTLAILLLVLSSPITIAIKAHKHDQTTESMSTVKTPLINDHEYSTKDLSIEPEMNLVEAMRTMNFWLLFAAMLCGMGSGLSTINNMSQIGESLGYTSRERSTLVSLWSIWNYLGRFGAGYVSDIFLHDKGLARPFFIALTLASMTAGHVIIGSGFPGNLYVGSVVVGICYGSLWSLMPTITSEIFGLRHMGTIFNTVPIASPLESYILSVRVIGYIYDREGGGSTSAGIDGNSSCIGTHCFMLSYFILASVSLFGFFVSLVLMMNTRGLYVQGEFNLIKANSRRHKFYELK